MKMVTSVRTTMWLTCVWMAITGSAGADLLFHRAMYMQAILQHDVAVDDDGDNAEDAQKI